jgi:hypothetical protein
MIIISAQLLPKYWVHPFKNDKITQADKAFCRSEIRNSIGTSNIASGAH